MMPNLHEILHPDSEITREISRDLVVEEIVEKTDTELWKALEDKNEEEITQDFVVEEMKKLNPEVQIETDRWFIFSSENGEKLKLPDWFYFNHKGEVTNYTWTEDESDCIIMKVYPISHYDPDCF